MESRLLIVVILGIGIRETFAPFTGHPFDFELWIRLGYYVSKGHDPYVVTAPVPNLSFPGAQFMTWIGYPPTWAFFQAAFYDIYSALHVNDRFVYYFIIKQPMIIGDLVCAFLIFKILSNYVGEHQAFRALAFWLLCPLTIIFSSVWGIFDQILLVLVLGSFLLVFETGKSSLLGAFGFALKVLPSIYFPVLALAQKTRPRVALYIVLSITASIALSLGPYLFFRTWSLKALESVGTDVVHKLGPSMNYWIVFGVLQNYGLHIPAAAISMLSYLAYAWAPALILSSLFCWTVIRKAADKQKALFLSGLFVTLIFFLTKSIVNEQYSLYFLVFGVFDYYVFANFFRRRLFHAVWISVLGFLIANNTFLVRFLIPLSLTYRTLDGVLQQGFAGDIRNGILLSTSLLFTAFCFLYARSLFSSMNKLEKLPLVQSKWSRADILSLLLLTVFLVGVGVFITYLYLSYLGITFNLT
jgi:hypothetical protein